MKFAAGLLRKRKQRDAVNPRSSMFLRRLGETRNASRLGREKEDSI